MTTSSLLEFAGRDLWDGPHVFVECRRALSPSGLPGIDYALNPYGGCAHGCVYCYAPEVTRSPWEGWRVVRVKANVAERLGRELAYVRGTVGVGTVTDPYQYAEARFRLTERCLELLGRSGCKVHIHTKSDLVLRDADAIAAMGGTVGVTVTGTDGRYSKMTEPGAPPPERRLAALAGLASAGVDAYALVEPVLSHLEGREEALVDAIAATGTQRMLLGGLNGRPLLSERVRRMGLGPSPKAVERVRELAEGAGIAVEDVFRNRAEDALYHRIINIEDHFYPSFSR